MSLAERCLAMPFHLDWYWAGLRGFPCAEAGGLASPKRVRHGMVLA
jgi:hypothetical protein